MDSLLSKNQVVELIDGRSVTVLGELGRGGQGIAYEVRVNGTNEIKVLKWYKPEYLSGNSREFYRNIEENIAYGSPSAEFLWPEALTEWKNNSFGYIMKKYPAEYKSFSCYLRGTAKFDNIEAMLNAAIGIVVAFRRLRVTGCSYQDLNDGNFALEPSHGKVLICDNDNVVGEGKKSGILGKIGYMAPELMRRESTVSRGDSIPDKWTDRFSLAVILFMLLVGDNPLEGKKTVGMSVEDAFSRPLFIFDKDDISNRPVPSIHRNAAIYWNMYPTFVQDAFCKSFSKNSLNFSVYRNERLNERQWLDVLFWLKSSLIRCPKCGELSFLDSNSTEHPICTFRCGECNYYHSASFYLRFFGQAATIINIPGFPGITIYSSVLYGDSVNVNDKLIKVDYDGEYIRLINESTYNFDIIRQSGRSTTVAPGESGFAYPGARINFYGRRGGNAKIIMV